MDEKLQTFIAIDSRDGVDLNIYQCGMEECHSDHAYGPSLRDHYLIHYILEGSGTFYMDDKEYQLKKGQGFLIPPNVITYYKASSTTPWTYVWVGFHGLKAENYLQRANLSRENPIFTCKDQNLERHIFQMMDIGTLSPDRDLELQGLLFLFIAQLVRNSPKDPISKYNSAEIYIKESIHFIQHNYSRPIKVGDIANNLSIDRSYFASIFKSALQKTPQEFLLEYRMNKACELLAKPELPISSIALSVGYTDAFNFSKMFKKVKGQSPTAYREFISE